MNRLLSILIIPLSSSLLLGTTLEWDGSSSVNVSDGANWTSNKAPKANSDLYFNTASAPTLSVYFDYSSGATTAVGDINFGTSAGSYTLSSDGSAVLQVGNISNDSSATQVFDIAIEFQNKETVLAGSPIQFNQAVTTKTGNSELTFSGGSEIIAGADDVFGSGIDLFLDNTTLDLSNTTQNFSSITVSGDSVIDFGGSDAALSIFELTVITGTLTVVNWTGDPGDFFVDSEVDSTSISNIEFAGWGDSSWDPDFGVQPGIVPEPRIYGALLMGLGALAYGARQRRLAKPTGKDSLPVNSALTRRPA